jgi:hypothetical protein
MTLLALEIPDAPTELSGWLEQQVVGCHLGALVAQLSAVNVQTVTGHDTLNQVLGPALPDLLSSGMAALPPGSLRQLLTQPRLLLELQELVFTRGGAYWEGNTAGQTQMGVAIGRGRARLKDFLRMQSLLGREKVNLWQSMRRHREVRGPVIALISTAAAAGFFFSTVMHTAPPSTQQQLRTADKSATLWGWQKPEGLPPGVSRRAYLMILADSAEEWFNERPDEPLALAGRLHEFRQGCSRLILSDHAPLPPADRDWLRDKCRNWARNLDGHVSLLEQGRDDDDVRRDSDRTIKSLISALRQRAAEERDEQSRRPVGAQNARRASPAIWADEQASHGIVAQRANQAAGRSAGYAWIGVSARTSLRRPFLEKNGARKIGWCS